MHVPGVLCKNTKCVKRCKRAVYCVVDEVVEWKGPAGVGGGGHNLWCQSLGTWFLTCMFMVSHCGVRHGTGVLCQNR